MDVPPSPHAIIAGFGIPGRFVAELLDFHSLPYCVIEINRSIMDRCKTAPIVIGDVRDEQVLKQAGIETATFLALTVPLEDIVLQATQVARRLRPDLRIIARVNYTSAGLKAQQMGANTVLIGEQLMAREFFRAIESDLTAAAVIAPAIDAPNA